MKAVHPISHVSSARIGARLRAARQAQRLTIEQVAEATGLTKGSISRIERDETSPSVATLTALCAVLSLPVGTLFEQPDAAAVELAEAPFINMGGRGAVERMVTPRGQSRIQVIRSDIEAGADGGDDLYTVNCEVEVVHVFAGELVLRFADREVPLAAGATMTFPGTEPHTWRCAVDTVCTWTLVPAPWSGSS